MVLEIEALCFDVFPNRIEKAGTDFFCTTFFWHVFWIYDDFMYWSADMEYMP